MARKVKAAPNPRWHRFSVRRKKGRWVAVFPHLTETTEATKGGNVYREPKRVEVPLRRDDGSAPADDADAFQLAENIYDWLEKERIRHRERGPQVIDMLDAGETTRWPIASAADDWATSRLQVGSQRTARERVSHWKSWAAENVRQFLDELTIADAHDFHRYLAAQAVADTTRQARWKAAHACLRWCVRNGRLPADPWAGVDAGKFVTTGKRHRELSTSIPIVHRHEREILLAACKTTQERLLLQLFNLLGLRASEAIHLRWRDFITHTAPPQLAIRHCKERGFQVKTGERLVPIIYPDVLDLLETHRQTTTGRNPEDWIIAKPNGEPFDAPPRKWIKRLQTATGTQWTPSIGRHTAASLLPLNVERLTGRRWSELEHAKFFGHDLQTSLKHYITQDLVDLARLESADAGSSHAKPEPLLAWPELSTEMAKRLLARLLQSNATSRLALAREISTHHSPLSETAIRKFQTTGQTIPPWFWAAIDLLLNEPLAG